MRIEKRVGCLYEFIAHSIWGSSICNNKYASFVSGSRILQMPRAETLDAKIGPDL